MSSRFRASIAHKARQAGATPIIHVCPLADVPRTVELTGSRHLVTLLANLAPAATPHPISSERHLKIRVDDISVDTPGMEAPAPHHVETLLSFVSHWDLSAPMLIHCYAGVSRSTAAAFVTMCALHPELSPAVIARALRRAAPWSQPNSLIVAHADDLLGRRGAMREAVHEIGPADLTVTPVPFKLMAPAS